MDTRTLMTGPLIPSDNNKHNDKGGNDHKQQRERARALLLVTMGTTTKLKMPVLCLMAIFFLMGQTFIASNVPQFAYRATSEVEDANVQVQVQDSGKPRFIIHLGPPKTATTSMQTDLVELVRNGMLGEDQYAYAGHLCLKKPFRGLHMCRLKMLFDKRAMVDQYPVYMEQLQQQQILSVLDNQTVPHDSVDAAPSTVSQSRALQSSSEIQIPRILRQAKSVLDGARQQGLSIIYSEEMESRRQKFEPGGAFHSPKYFDSLRHLLEDWDVSVVITYRRVFDWVLSSHKQTMGADVEKHGTSSRWIDATRYNDTWDCMRNWMQEHTAPTRSMGSKYVFIDGILPAWRGFPVRILNFHDERHISQQFLCDWAPRSCAFLQDKTQNPPKNARHMVWYRYNDIVFTAAQRGVIDASRNRLEMVNELSQYHSGVLNKTMADLPLRCPPEDELQQLLAMSLAVEKEWMPQWYASPQGEAAHRLAFHRTAYEKREFCSVDMDRLFEGVDSWDGLLDRLKHTWL